MTEPHYTSCPTHTVRFVFPKVTFMSNVEARSDEEAMLIAMDNFRYTYPMPSDRAALGSAEFEVHITHRLP